MATSRRNVGATVVVDSRGTVLSVAIDDAEPGSPKGITHGFVLEPGQRVVNVKIPFDPKKIDTEELLALVRNKVPRPSKAKAKRSAKRKR
jgi:hypothetical protein